MSAPLEKVRGRKPIGPPPEYVNPAPGARARGGAGRRAADALEARIADQVFTALRAGRVELLIEWLVTLGCRWAVRSEGGHAVDGLTGMRCGFVLADPVTLAVQSGFALAGPFWPQVYPGLLGEVNRRWKAERKGAR